MCNPILNLIPNELYETLMRLNLLNKKMLRDIEMKRRYTELRQAGYTSNDAIEMMLNDYPYLQFDTVRKIIYSVHLPDEVMQYVAA
ncbi:MAG: hypothetical protein ACKVTZ_09850 [Bacteroidia bacterium]